MIYKSFPSGHIFFIFSETEAEFHSSLDANPIPILYRHLLMEFIPLLGLPFTCANLKNSSLAIEPYTRDPMQAWINTKDHLTPNFYEGSTFKSG